MAIVKITIELPDDVHDALAAIAQGRGASETPEQIAAAMVAGVIREIVAKQVDRILFIDNPNYEGL
jgi:hypothetical protein